MQRTLVTDVANGGAACAVCGIYALRTQVLARKAFKLADGALRTRRGLWARPGGRGADAFLLYTVL